MSKAEKDRLQTSLDLANTLYNTDPKTDADLGQKIMDMFPCRIILSIPMTTRCAG